MKPSRSGPTDEALLAAYARGNDREALGRLVERHLALAYALARSVLASPDDAEDAVQNAAVKLMRKARTFKEGSPVRPWLAAVVLNEAKNLARGRASSTVRDEKAGRARRGASLDPAEAASQGETEGRVLAALATLEEE